VSQHRWRRVFPGQEGELRQVRYWLTELLPDCPARSDVLTVTIELAANAMRHSASGLGGFFAVELSWLANPATVRIAVADAGGLRGPQSTPGAGLAALLGTGPMAALQATAVPAASPTLNGPARGGPGPDALPSAGPALDATGSAGTAPGMVVAPDGTIPGMVVAPGGAVPGMSAALVGTAPGVVSGPGGSTGAGMVGPGFVGPSYLANGPLGAGQPDLDPGRLELPSIGPLAPVDPASPTLREHGRGLRLVAALATRAGVVGDHRGRLVWADVRWADDTLDQPGFLDGYTEALRDIQTVLAARYPEVNIWFGRTSMQWWAMAPYPAPGWLLTAESPLDLAALLDVYRVTQRPPAPVRRRSRGRHGLPSPRPVLPGEQPHRGSWLAVA
jgi:hypothetical protein